MTGEGSAPNRLPVAQLARRGGHSFEIVPDAAGRAALAAHLDLTDLRKLRLAGAIARDAGTDGWRLDATLGATVVQPCGITLAPVTTRIDEAVTRRYSPDIPPPEALTEDEMEMPDDDSLEPLGAVIDLDAVLAEALALALPPWPRAAGATFDTAPAPAAPDDDGPTRRPFAGLRARLEGHDDEADDESR